LLLNDVFMHKQQAVKRIKEEVMLA